MLEMGMDDVMARAVRAPAFSNGFEWENWAQNWCVTCKHDVTYGGTGDCPLITVSLLSPVTPAEWREVALGGLANRYECTKYEPREGEDDARGQVPDRVRGEHTTAVIIDDRPVWSPPDMDH